MNLDVVAKRELWDAEKRREKMRRARWYKVWLPSETELLLKLYRERPARRMLDIAAEMGRSVDVLYLHLGDEPRRKVTRKRAA